MDNKELENRLIKFSVLVIHLAGKLTKTFAGRHLAKQAIRSGTSIALNYGEALAGESRRDFTHKIKVVLKELRETFITLSIVKEAELCSSTNLVQQTLKENDELIAIFVTTVKTVEQGSRSQIDLN